MGEITIRQPQPNNATNTEITGWTISGQNGSIPNNVDLVHTFFYPSFTGTSGSNSLDMEGAIGASGVISQSFATTPGDKYTLSFEYANNPQPGPRSSGMANVLVTGTVNPAEPRCYSYRFIVYKHELYPLFSRLRCELRDDETPIRSTYEFRVRHRPRCRLSEPRWDPPASGA